MPCAVVGFSPIGIESPAPAPVENCDCWACERTRKARHALQKAGLVF